jgi:hypothetical protein
MDNGLIFPYPCGCAHGEAGDTNHPKLLMTFGLLVVERGT